MLQLADAALFREGLVLFTRAPQSREDVAERYEIQLATWQALGEPHAVTVTIRPGDRLNQEQ